MSESFNANASVLSATTSSFIEPIRGLGDSASILGISSASQRLRELNSMEINIEEDRKGVDIYRSDAPEIDFDLKNQQNLDYSKANLVSNVSSSVSKHEKDVDLIPNNF